MSEPRTAADGPMRELTPDEIVADIEAMKPRKHKVTIYQAWPRMILERERKRAEASRIDVPPETEAVRRCVTHHACVCHERLAEIGRRYIKAYEAEP
jgi:hypothetical protein